MTAKTWPPLFQKGAGRAESPDGSCAASVTTRLCVRTELINCACPLVTHPSTGPSKPNHLNDGTNKGRAEIDHSLSAWSLISQGRHKKQPSTLAISIHTEWVTRTRPCTSSFYTNLLAGLGPTRRAPPPALRKAAEHKGGVDHLMSSAA